MAGPVDASQKGSTQSPLLDRLDKIITNEKRSPDAKVDPSTISNAVKLEAFPSPEGTGGLLPEEQGKDVIDRVRGRLR